MCVDYRALNSARKGLVSLPNIRELIDKLAGAKWFSAFDVLWGYHNIPLAKDSIPKTAFIANDELLEFTRLPFGLCNAPATFQRMMCTALIGMGHISATYLDDVLVFAGTLEDLLRRMHIILQRLMSVGLKLKPRKCELCTNSVVYLGFNIDANGVSPIPSKLEIIQNWTQPDSMKALRGFLGFVNRYFSFYPHLAVVSAPLARATGKKQFGWSSELQSAFERTKSALKNINTLAIPTPNGQLILETDASGYGIGAVLLQMQGEQELPVAYFSKALNDAQKNYEAFKLEMYALVKAVQYFQIYLAGAHFIVRTDNMILRYWNTMNVPGGNILARWRAILASYSFDIEHKAGVTNTIADTLSRYPDAVPNTQMKPARSGACSSKNLFVFGGSIRDHYNDDHERILGQLKTGVEIDPIEVRSGSLELRELASNVGRLVIHNGLIHIRNAAKQLVAYAPLAARDDVLKAAHSTAHQSTDKMHAALKIRFWWPSMKRDIARYVDQCMPCTKARMPVPTRKAPLQIFPAASRFELVHLDILGGSSSWQKSPRGNRYILVIIDHFSRYCVAVAIAHQTAEEVAESFFRYWIMKFGCPMRVHTDQGANFESSLVCRALPAMPHSKKPHYGLPSTV